MCISPSSASKLAEIYEVLTTGRTLTIRQCEQLANGFLACNLIIAISEILAKVFSESRTSVSQGVDHASLCAAFAEGDIAPFTSLALQLPAEEEFLRDYHPWSCMDRWMTLDSLVVASGQELPDDLVQQPPSAIAQTLFLSLLGGYLPASSCSTRSRRAVEAFSLCWSETQSQLVAVLERTRTEIEEFRLQSYDFLKPVFGMALSNSLDSGVVAALTMAKNNQLQNCIGKLNDRIPYPEEVKAGWIVSMFDRLIVAQDMGRDYEISRDDHARLRRLLAWVAENNIDRDYSVDVTLLHIIAREEPPVRIHHGVRPDAATSLPSWLRRYNIALRSLAMTEGPRLQIWEFLDAWNELATVVRCRGLPADWAASRAVEDILRCPLTDEFSFVEWQDGTGEYGLGA